MGACHGKACKACKPSRKRAERELNAESDDDWDATPDSRGASLDEIDVASLAVRTPRGTSIDDSEQRKDGGVVAAMRRSTRKVISAGRIGKAGSSKAKPPPLDTKSLPSYSVDQLSSPEVRSLPPSPPAQSWCEGEASGRWFVHRDGEEYPDSDAGVAERGQGKRGGGMQKPRGRKKRVAERSEHPGPPRPGPPSVQDDLEGWSSRTSSVVSVDHLQEDDANGAAGGDDASGPQRGDPEHTRHSVARRLRRAQAQLMQARSTRAEAASELEFSEKAESTSYAAAMRSAETKQQAAHKLMVAESKLAALKAGEAAAAAELARRKEAAAIARLRKARKASQTVARQQVPPSQLEAQRELVKQVRTERQKEGSMERRPSSNMEASPSGKAVQSGSSSSTPIEHDKPPSAIVKSGEMQFYKTPDLDFTPVKSAVAPSRVTLCGTLLDPMSTVVHCMLCEGVAAPTPRLSTARSSVRTPHTPRRWGPREPVYYAGDTPGATAGPS